MLNNVTAWAHSHGKAVKTAAAMLIACAMVFAVVLVAPQEAMAAERAMTRTVDPATFTQWTEGVGDPVNPSSTGRVWADKSVADGDVTLTTYDGKDVTVANGADDEFLVGLSAMSSAQEITGVTGGSNPLDVTLVLDVSGSMASGMGSRYVPTYGPFDTERVPFILSPYTPGTYDDLYTEMDADGKKLFYVYGNPESADGRLYVEPKTSAEDTDPNHVQFYWLESTTRLDALKQSVNGFLNLMAQRNAAISDEALRNRAGIVTYETSSEIASGYSTDTAQLKATVDALTDLGGTNAGLGLENAQKLIASSKRVNADSVVIFFTDGSPWDTNLAVQKAHELKAGGNTIYSIGVFRDADSNDLDLTPNKFMQAVSSNYPQAVCTENNEWILGPRAEGDYYLTASDSDQLQKIFQDIWTAISSKPSSPIASTTTESGVERGTVTFTDTLGDYMAVRDFKSVIFAGRQFNKKSVTTADGVTTVAFEGEVEGNAIYGTANLADLQITVKHGEGSQGDVVTVAVPEQLLPLRMYSATVDQNGAVTTSIKRTHPIRVFYTVGLKDGVREQLDSPGEELSTYLAANTSADGAVSFTSNAYKPNAQLGSTTATFTPAQSNAFYYFTEDTPLYNSKNTADRAKVIDATGTYYYQRTYYADNAAHEQWIAVSGAAADGKVAQGADGNWYGKAGSARLGLANYTRTKTENVTGTASTAIAPNWDGASVSVALGNNGRLAFAPAAVATPETPVQTPVEPQAPADGPAASGTVDVPVQAVQQVGTASTGSTIAAVAVVAVVLLSAGATLLIVVRRRS